MSSKIEDAKTSESLKTDADLLRKSEDILHVLEGFSDQKISPEIIETVLKTQQLVGELEKMDNDCN